MKRRFLFEQPLSNRERAILVGVSGRGIRKAITQEYLEELTLLADTAGADVIEKIVQDRDRIDPAYFIGKGKVEEIARLVEENEIALVIFDDDLSSVQARNLEQAIGCKVLDRSGLILDIFASRAKTNEAKTQVELAQLQYLLPRLTRQWTHLSKQYGGIGTKGPGEKQLETDRRIIRNRIRYLKERLEHIDQERQTQHKGRRDLTRIALIGYTNVGKSTLLNLLAGSDVFVEDRLFATLDATTRLVTLGRAQKVLITDTVGFIRKLPHHLVASFKSTLAEVTEANMLLHVVDVSSPQFEEQSKVVNTTLGELQSGDKPTIMVFNKIDKVTDFTFLRDLERRYENAISISAARGINLSGLKEKILSLLEVNLTERTLVVKQSDYKVIAFLHDVAEVLEKTYLDNRVRIRFRIKDKDMRRVQTLLQGGKTSTVEDS
ncbi:MAG: GTPase HflX [Bacteroidota bacterium]